MATKETQTVLPGTPTDAELAAQKKAEAKKKRDENPSITCAVDKNFFDAFEKSRAAYSEAIDLHLTRSQFAKKVLKAGLQALLQEE